MWDKWGWRTRGTEPALYINSRKLKRKQPIKRQVKLLSLYCLQHEKNPSPNGEGFFLLYHTFVVYPYRSCSPIISFN